jgi:ketosteroid isomerase-like protein
MGRIFNVGLILFVATRVFSQADVQPLLQVQNAFDKAASERGMKSAFLEFLGDDAIIFQPHPMNGKKYWNSREGDPGKRLLRTTTYSDISANGLLGYTTGNWRLFSTGRSESDASFGQYVTIWEKKTDGTFQASVDIAISHEKMPFYQTDRPVRKKQTRDINKRGWSPADASMNFLRTSMSNQRLGGAYKKFAGDDVRLLRDGEPPIIGKKHVVEEMNYYISVLFPTKVTTFQAADMAYTWNNCSFDNSKEGQVQGNCLHIWKLRNKKWWIVLGVFAPVPNDRPPVLIAKPKR